MTTKQELPGADAAKHAAPAVHRRAFLGTASKLAVSGAAASALGVTLTKDHRAI